MFSESAELYDAIYRQLKNYPAEAERIVAGIQQWRPGARTVLDVGCGTGEHALRIAAHGFSVDGLDADAALLAIAERKHEAGRFAQGDMASFMLDRQYDVILCLFSSIAYVGTLERLVEALRCFQHHLAIGGIVVVEPWFAPGVLDPTRVTRVQVRVGDVEVERVSRLEISGAVSHLYFEYSLTGPAGVRHAREHHALGLFTPDEMLAAFGRAGLEAHFDPVGLTGRGLYVAGRRVTEGRA